MKKIIGITLIALFAIAMSQPSMAQTRKMKKEIKQLENQAVLDSIKRSIQLREEQDKLKMIKAQQDIEQKVREGVAISMPCIDDSYDDDNYFREVGTGTHSSNNLQSARQAALTSAQEMIKQKMAQFVQGFSKSYFQQHSGSAATDDIERRAQNEMQSVIEGMLNATQKTCEVTRVEDDGKNHCYVAVQISKEEFLTKCKNALSNDERLKIDFDEAQFDKIAKEEMGKMKAARTEAGY